MNYYDELGVSPKASAGEIHEAYKALARLLHPDNQSDEKMRSLAERQMKRLNEVFALLSDPAKRKEYDESLAYANVWQAPPPRVNLVPVPAAPPSEPAGTLRLVLRNWFWISITLVLVASTVWFFLESNGPAPVRISQVESRPVNSAPDETAPRVPGRPATHSEKRATPPTRIITLPAPSQISLPSQAQPKNPALENPTAVSIQSAPASQIEIPPERRPEMAVVNSETSSAVPSPAPASPLPAVSSVKPDVPAPKPAVNINSSFAGNWLYLSNPDPPQPGFYPPEYIEFSLTEQAGMLSGKYKARYKVTDRLIPPDVLIAVEGKVPNGKSALLPWSSKDGAKGEMELVLNTPNSMNVRWWTTQFGQHSALTSGTALLVRQTGH